MTAAPLAETADLVVSTHGLTKRFRGGQLAVDGVGLSVDRGAVYGFLGPNGSGKTTTIRMLLGLVAPSAGEVTLLGAPMPRSARDVLPRVGALVEGPAFQPYLSGAANLRRLDRVDATADPRSSTRRIGAALDRVGLAAAAAKPYRKYSLGMKQRLGIAAALLQPRELLVLDEPTNGLDPQGTREIRTLVRELAADGITVLISSHLLTEIEQVCSHVGIMSAGRLVTQGTLAQVRGTAGETRLRVETVDTHRALEVLGTLDLSPVVAGPDRVEAALGELAVERVAAALVAADVGLRGLAVLRPGLEELFVGLTGEGFDVAG